MSRTKTLVKREASTTNVIIVAVLVSVVSLGLAGLTAKSLFSSIQLQAKILSKKSLAAATLETNLKAAPRLVDQYNSIGEGSQLAVARALPIDPDYPGLIAMMERVTQISATKMDAIAPTESSASDAGAPSSQPTSQAYPFAIHVSGSYASIKALLSNLELSARPMRLNSITLSGGSSAMSADLSLTTYYQGSASLALDKETVK